MANIGAGLAGAASGYASGGWVGAALGGIGGLFGGKEKRGPSPQDILKFNRQQTFAHFRNTMQAAKESGIHPIYALGSGFQPQPLAELGQGGTPGNGVREALAMGQDLGEAVARRGTKEQRAMADIVARQAVERGALENEQLRLQNQRLKSPTLGPAAPSGVSGNIIPGQADASSIAVPSGTLEALKNMPMPLGYEKGANPLHSVAYDEQGNPIRLFNTNALGDNDIAQWLHTIRYTLPDYVHGTGSALARSWANWLRSARAKGAHLTQVRKGG